MNPTSSLLFAIDRTRWSDIANGLRPRPMATTDLLWLMLAILGVALGFAAIAHLLSWRDRRHNRPRPLLLFLSLCRLHRLRWRDRWLLWRLARSLGLRDPARLFLEAGRFSPKNLPAPLAANPRFPILRDQLFGSEAQQRKADAPEAAASIAQVAIAGITAGAPMAEPTRNPLAPRQPRPTLDLPGVPPGLMS